MRLIEPLGLIDGPAADLCVERGLALPLAGGPAAFSLVRLYPGGEVVPACDIPPAWSEALTQVTRRRPPWAGMGLATPAVMGVVNLTPDSFSDGGDRLDPAIAIAAVQDMVAAGAALIDIGGESTRPGSQGVSVATEIDRVVPVLRGLAGVRVSVDTRNAATMAAALDAGAAVINDVSALRHDPDAAGLLAARGCPVVLMHMRGTPATMQDLAVYDDVALDVVTELAGRIADAERAGIARDNIAIDPGIGFAKTGDHSLNILGRLPLLANLGCHIVVGASRKRFIGVLAGGAAPRARGPGSLAAALYAASRGANLVRVHDAADTAQALRVWGGISNFRDKVPADMLI